MINKKPNKKPKKKLSEMKRLSKKLSDLCSEYVRKRDGKCILCGKHTEYKNLAAHHWIKTKARSLKYRYDPRNLVSLCYGCHICQIHNNPTISIMEELKQKCINNNIVTEKEIEEIKNDNEVVKWKAWDYEIMIDGMKSMINNL